MCHYFQHASVHPDEKHLVIMASILVMTNGGECCVTRGNLEPHTFVG
jgi:hypothetical protein